MFLISPSLERLFVEQIFKVSNVTAKVQQKNQNTKYSVLKKQKNAFISFSW